MREEPSILHADVDSFFASVEQRRDPSLRGRAVLVGVGVVMAASYKAKACGVKGGMSGAAARRLCPEAIAVEPHFGDYTDVSRELFALFRRTAPIVEGLSLEEAFLDVDGLERISGSPEEIAARLRREVRDELGLPISVGIARTQTLAKMASRAAKPDGLLVVPAGGERDFLHPLPVESIWGVGAATARRIHRLGVRTVGDLAATPEASLIAALGKHAGSHLHALANLREHRRVRPRTRRRSIGSQAALGRGRHPRAQVERTVGKLVDRVAGRMRNAGRAGPHRDPPAALRRLLEVESLADPAACHRLDRVVAGGRRPAPRRGTADHPRAWADAGRRDRLQPRRHQRGGPADSS